MSSGGDDGAVGNAAAPWRTLQHAANQVTAGDTVIVRAGAYTGFVLGWDFSQNGTWGIFTGFSDDVLIENNVASRSRLEHGIYVSNSTVRPVVRGNLVWGNQDAAIHMNGDLSQGGNGLITERWSRPILPTTTVRAEGPASIATASRARRS